MHHVQGRKLGRKSAHRRAMMANIAASLIRHERIETTLPKAKELRPLAEQLVTLGKRGTLHAHRRAVQIIRDKGAVHKLFAELAPRFSARNGGYTRILKLGWRHGDAAPMAAIEYLEAHGHKESGEGEKAPKAAKKKEHAEKKAAPKAEKVVHKAKPAKKAAPAVKHTAKRASPAHKATRSGEK